MPQNAHATITTERLDLLTVAGQVDLDGLGQLPKRLDDVLAAEARSLVADLSRVPGYRRRAVRPGGADEPTARMSRGLAAAGRAGPAGVERARPGRAARCSAVSGLGRGGSWGRLGPPTAAVIDCHAGELGATADPAAAPPPRWDRPATARPAGGPGAGAAGDRGHGRVPPGRDAASASRRAETIPVRAWRAGRRRDVRRGGARIHTSPTLRGRGAGSGVLRGCVDRSPTPPRCAMDCCGGGSTSWACRPAGAPCTR